MNKSFYQNTIIEVFFCAFLAIILSGCASEPFLYDKTGFERGEQPNISNPDAPVKVAPDYYYRQPSYSQQVPPSSYQQPSPYQQQPQYYYQQQPQPSYYYPPVQYNPYGNTGGSRFYSNPYAIPPSNQYPNYDADQYYVPPANYNNVEPVQKVVGPSQIRS